MKSCIFTNFGVTLVSTQEFWVITEVTPKWVKTLQIHSKFTLNSLIKEWTFSLKIFYRVDDEVVDTGPPKNTKNKQTNKQTQKHNVTQLSCWTDLNVVYVLHWSPVFASLVNTGSSLVINHLPIIDCARRKIHDLRIKTILKNSFCDQ